jgi:hypothetical protein
VCPSLLRTSLAVSERFPASQFSDEPSPPARDQAARAVSESAGSDVPEHFAHIRDAPVDMSETNDDRRVAPPSDSSSNGSSREGDGDMSDLLQELRVLLQGVQVLTGFLIVLPFSEGFSRVSEFEKKVYLVLFLCVLVSLVFFSAPAAQHRLLSPLRDRVQFKHFVLDEVASERVRDIATLFVGFAIAFLWWIAPLIRRRKTGV